MDVKSQEILEGILAKDKSSLNDEEVRFLRARRDYLNDEQRKRFAEILDGDDSGDGLDAMSVADLKALAEEKEVDLEGASKKADVIAKLREAGVTA